MRLLSLWISGKLCAVRFKPDFMKSAREPELFHRIENNSDQRPRAREPNSVREIGKFVKSGFRCCYNTKMMRQITALLSVYIEFVTFQHCGVHLAGYSSASPEHMGKCNPSATRWLLQSTKKHQEPQFFSNLQQKLLLSTTFHASTFCLKGGRGKK